MSGLPLSSEFDFASVLRRDDHVAWPQGPGEPTGLSARLLAQLPGLPDITLVLGMVTTRTLDLLQDNRPGFLCLNGAANTRRAAALSNNRIVPAHVSAIPGLILSGRIRVDVALVRVRPTADPDILSLGVMVDFVHEMIAAARVIVAEIDERMPLTADDALLERGRITRFAMADGPEPLIFDPEPSERDVAVAGRAAELIPDRATVQLGVGGLPVAVCAALRDHRGLGLHSGVLPDAAVDLIEAGAVDNRHKGVDPGVAVTGGLFGSRRLLDFADENRAIGMRRASYTHSVRTLSQIQTLYTINSAVEIDLSGQVNSEIAGHRYVGAVGGQVDFVRGGRLSPGGRSIVAMASVTPDGKHSKIVASLGAKPVTTARSDVDLVVTEFGAADLWGLDLHARAEALTRIAHPNFQGQLQSDFERTLTTAN